METKRFVLLKRPVGIPDESAFGLEDVIVPTGLKDGELRLHGVYYSVDPYMRGRMNAGSSYIAPFALNKPIEGHVVARVSDSKAPHFKSGDLVYGQLPWATDMVVPHELVKRIDLRDSLASEYLGVLGMTGLTAYFGMLKIGRPKSGDTVVISGAAGAVGGVAGQIAKISGCRVVGIVGSDEKSRLIQEHFKFDSAINYKKALTAKVLQDKIKESCPNGIDVYFDNVGGPISEAVMQNMNTQGRIVVCGQIALYNLNEIPKETEIEPLLLARSISMKGFSVSDFEEQFPEATQQLSKWLSEGKIESSETILDGFANLPKALIGLFSGKNIGKMIVKAAA